MKTYCKNVDITDRKQVTGWIFDYLKGDNKRAPKWARKDYRPFMANWSCYSVAEIETAIRECNHNVLLEICADIAEEICSRIENRNLRLQPIQFFKRIDGISLKEREISHESVMQQNMDAVAVAALMPLLRAKIMPHQFASIKKRGQVAGKNKIEKWIRRDKRCRVYGKADVVKCFRSVRRAVVLRLLGRDIHKNKLLLWFVEALLATYYKIENGVIEFVGLVIGTLLSQWLCNYVLSYLFRYIARLEKVQVRRGIRKTIKLAVHTLFYMDDILVIGSRKADVESALRKAAVWAKKTLGVKLHDGVQALEIKNNNIDMMGYVVGKKKTTIRARIFLRARRHYLRAGVWLRKNRRLTLKRAQDIVSYYGYFIRTNSVKVMARLNVEEICKKAKKDISFYMKTRLLKGAMAA